MKDMAWEKLNDLRVWLIHKRAPARLVNAVSRLCRLLWPMGYHAGRREKGGSI